DPVEIAGLIARQKVSHILCLPSLYQHLLETQSEALANLRVVIVAGETCKPDLVEWHQKILPGAALYNEYGPTEATVWTTVFDCHRAVPGFPVSIGKPISNAAVYVLDSSRQPVPVLVPGEIYIGGAGVAVGYLNRPDETVARFIPDPFSAEQGASLYRTGDLGRFLPDGNLEFLGRVDQQVKIRGFRIELEEVEAGLRQQPRIREGAGWGPDGTNQ